MLLEHNSSADRDKRTFNNFHSSYSSPPSYYSPPSYNNYGGWGDIDQDESGKADDYGDYDDDDEPGMLSPGGSSRGSDYDNESEVELDSTWGVANNYGGASDGDNKGGGDAGGSVWGTESEKNNVLIVC